jgi:hypothetical protein
MDTSRDREAAKACVLQHVEGFIVSLLTENAVLRRYGVNQRGTISERQNKKSKYAGADNRRTPMYKG